MLELMHSFIKSKTTSNKRNVIFTCAISVTNVSDQNSFFSTSKTKRLCDL